MLLFARPGNSAFQTIGGSFDGSTWTTTDIGNNMSGGWGGGVVVADDLEGLAVAPGIPAPAGAVLSATSSLGSWQQLAPAGNANFVGTPAAGLSGAFVVNLPTTSPPEYQLAEYDASTDQWLALEGTGVFGDGYVPPAAVRANGEPMFVTTDAANSRFRSVRRSEGMWQAPVAIPGAAFLNDTEVNAIAPAGSSDVLAVLRNDFVARWSVWSNGAWSLAEDLVTDPLPGNQSIVDLAALPGGRVALAYLDTTYTLRLALYDGTSWTSFQAVPGAPTISAAAIARGCHDCAVLELVYAAAADGYLFHTRLTDELA